MNYIIAAAIIGALIGIASAYNKKTWLLVLILTPLFVWIASKFSASLPSIVEVEGNLFATFKATFDQMTESGKLAVKVFPLALIGGQIIGWFFKPSPNAAVNETSKDRKKRILKEYNFN